LPRHGDNRDISFAESLLKLSKKYTLYQGKSFFIIKRRDAMRVRRFAGVVATL
jgi:hypothetical protein